MAKQYPGKKENTGYADFKKDFIQGSFKNAYVFYGEEHYLMEYYLRESKKKLLSGGMEEFNYRRFDGRSMELGELAVAVDSFPMMAERTVVEVWDYDMGAEPEGKRQELLGILSDLPEYVCIFFVFDTVEFKLDGRSRLNSEISKRLEKVEFALQDQTDIVNWIFRRFKALNKTVSREDAEYLSFITGGLMTNLTAEIEKLGSYAQHQNITKKDIDTVVIPTVEAELFKLSDAIIKQDYKRASRIMADVISQQEAPHKIISILGTEMRRLLAAKTAVSSGMGTAEFMQMCGIRHEFIARNLFSGARQKSREWCRESVRLCSQAAYDLNTKTKQEYNRILTQVICDMAMLDR